MNSKKYQEVSRNLISFEAPLSLKEKTKQMADEEMCSTSVICRKALTHYISTNEARKIAEEMVVF